MSLSKSERTILQVMAKERERTYYQLWKKDEVAHSNKTVQIALKKLQQKGFIKPKKKTRGNERKPYVMTLKGLVAVVLQPGSSKYIKQIAGTQEKLLPLILGKWQHYRESGLTETQLFNALQRICIMAQMYKQETIGNIMRYFSLYTFTETEFHETVNWLKAFHSDQQLRGWALVEELYYSTYISLLRTMFHSINQANPDWEDVLKHLCGMSYAPLRARTEKDREILEKELLDRLEE